MRARLTRWLAAATVALTLLSGVLPRVAPVVQRYGVRILGIGGAAAALIGGTRAAVLHSVDRGADETARLVVVLDPGHGGRQRSNRGPTGYVEADGALDMALRTRTYLEAAGVEVHLTRTADVDLSPSWLPYSQSRDLTARARVANNLDADLLLSIHSNAMGGEYAGRSMGTETFAQFKSADSQAAGVELQRQLLLELQRPDRGVKVRVTLPDGTNAYYPVSRLPAAGRDYYGILRQSDGPALIVEVAFHDNPVEEALLRDPAFRDRAAWAMARGIIRWARETGIYLPGPVGFAVLEIDGRQVWLPGFIINGSLHVDYGAIQALTGRDLTLTPNAADLVALRAAVQAAWPGARIEWQERSKTATVRWGGEQ